MTSYSEDATDVWIAENLTLPEHGWYCDIGAAHPQRYSQTAFLRDRGWTGYAVDANDAYRAEWSGVYGAVFHQAVIGDGNPKPFLIEPTNTLVSRFEPAGVTVPTVRLADLLRGIGHIDFMALDIEGGEYDALLSLDWSRHRPSIIVSEFHSEHFGRDPRVMNLLISKGYKLVHLTDNNTVFIS